MKNKKIVAAVCGGLLVTALAVPSFAGRHGFGSGGSHGQRSQVHQRLRDGSCLGQEAATTRTQERERIQNRERTVQQEMLQERERLQEQERFQEQERLQEQERFQEGPGQTESQ